MKKLLLVVGVSLISFAICAAPIGYKQYKEPPPAPDFRLVDQTGRSHTLGDYLGKVLVVNFWATWCGPCVREMPSLQLAANQLKSDNVRVIGVAVGETRDDINRYLQKQRIDFPLLADAESSATGKWHVPGLPTTYVVNPKGLVVMRIIGPVEWDSEEWLHRLRTIH